MTEMELREEIRRYEPFNEQEREDKEEILRQMEQTDHILTRDNQMCIRDRQCVLYNIR